MSRTLRVGIGGPIGCGKTELIEKLTPRLKNEGLNVGIVTNDIYSKEDARRMSIKLDGVISPDEIIGIETGLCPHTAVRDDPSMNLEAVNRLESENGNLDIILIESGGDNVTLTFSNKLADMFIYMIDVASGDKTVRKGGLGILKSDLLLINKIDLSPYVETTIPESETSTANLQIMKEDAAKIRPDKPTVFISLKEDNGIDEIVSYIKEKGLYL
ncbi:urease accessory protein UreG [Candidatus Methanomassiliicoccus intestinalis]|mgnify:CR=1 FL=1|jgi:urease accessory protein ureG|uniref:Urease accessory protein UreG n=1 Tax=Methanomassiliicoccus intestinalis (strain Issoire-Mx1) TaxID=1295009 RepID=R9T931_METII|nr:urease accessory protein UreG [Candidatus Methanomassiliicoccus intestinalis]AGN27149.1 urease accessory protein UreG [Candidatus Methanomassiliicoccus intestinalis Issoire-Mx1]TQS81666.1 MAG: urease accessory protein UreG [Candidatus Methanomassiliicoccus intestinalis]